MTYEVLLHYGDTNQDENVSGNIYHSLNEAKHTARKCNDYMDYEDYEKGDYYFVRAIS